MPRGATVLKDLLKRRHQQPWATFCRQYDLAARGVDPALVGRWPSRGQYARWLAGDVKGLPHPDHCRVLEAMFPGRTAQELFSAAGAPEDPLPDAPADPPAGAGTGAPPRVVPPAPRHAVVDLTGTPGAAADPIHRPVDRRAGDIAVILGGPAPLTHEEVAMATEESAGFVRAERGHVDHDVLDQLGADVRQFAVDYLTRPPLALFRPLAGLRHEVFDLLDRRQRPTVLPPLYSVAGRLCALLAHASADLGHDYAADTHTRTAWLCADLADDDSLRAYVRWVQANVAFWRGDHRRAAEIAHAGQRFATKGSNLLRLASQEARAWAACGEAREVERALAVATSAREQDQPDEQAGVFRFDPGKAAYYASEVRLALGGTANARLAVSAAEEALRLFDETPQTHRSPEFLAAARCDLANARLALGDLDGAAGDLRIVLDLPVESRTQPIVGRVTSAAVTLVTPRFTRSALAQELVEEIGLFQAYPAHRDLPEVPY